MHCYICDFCEDLDGNGWNKVTVDPILDKPICKVCLAAAKQARFGSVELSESVTLDQLVKELESRIPALFDPTLPVCPGNCACNCEKTCILLANST